MKASVFLSVGLLMLITRHPLPIIGEGWLPTNDISSVKGALQVSGEHSGSPIVPTMERIPTTEQHPTFHRTNKYTAGYQVGGS